MAALTLVGIIIALAILYLLAPFLPWVILAVCLYFAFTTTGAITYLIVGLVAIGFMAKG